MKSDLLEELGRVVVLRCRECGGLDVELIVLPPPLGIAIRCRKIWCNATAVVSPTVKGTWRNQKA